MSFDPDAFLAAKPAAVAPAKGFDPDVFLQGTPTPAPAPASSIDEDMDWAKKFAGVDYAKNKMTSEEKANFALLAKVSDNSADAQKQAFNMAYVHRILPDIPLPTMQKNWEAVKQAFAGSALGLTDGAVSDGKLYGAINDRVNNNLMKHFATGSPMDRLKMLFGAQGYGDHDVEEAVPMIGSESAGTKGGAFTIPKMEGTGSFAGLINATNRVMSGLTSPENAAFAVVTGGLGVFAELAQGTRVAVAARAAQSAVVGTFAASSAKDTTKAYAQAKMVLADPHATDAEKTDAIATVVLSGAVTAAAAKGTFDLGMETKVEAGKDGVKTPQQVAKETAQQVEVANLLRDEANKAESPELKQVLTEAAHQEHPHAANGAQIFTTDGGFEVVDAIGNPIGKAKSMEEAKLMVERANEEADAFAKHEDNAAHPSDMEAPEAEAAGEPVATESGKPATGTTGIAQRVNESRGSAVEAGEGVSGEAAVERGRRLLKEGFDVDKAIRDFQKDPQKQISFDALTAIRARVEELSKAANAAADEHGLDSPEYKKAAQAEESMREAVKPMSTETHKAMMAHQGETEIDTGTYHGMARALRDATRSEGEPGGKAPTPEQLDLIKEKVDAVNKATAREAKASRDIARKGKEATSDEVAQPRKSTRTKYLKERADQARARISARLEKLVTAGVTEGEDVGGFASKENLSDLAIVKEFGERIKPHLQDLFSKAKDTQDSMELERQNALIEARKEKLKNRITELKDKIKSGDTSPQAKAAIRPSIEAIEKLEQERDSLSKELSGMRDRAANIKDLKDAIAEKSKKIAEGDISTEGQPKNRPAEQQVELLKRQRDALNKQLDQLRNPPKPKREAMSETEKGSRRLDRQIAEIERQIKEGEVFPEGKAPKAEDPALAEKKARLEHLKYERDNIRETLQGEDVLPDESPTDTISEHKAGSAWTAEQSKALWDHGSELMDAGKSYDDMRHALAKEYGLPVDDVTEGLAAPKGMKEITDDLWKKQADKREAINEAKRWVAEQKYPGWQKAFNKVHDLTFNILTFGHGTAWFTTHASSHIFVPKTTGPIITELGRAFRMMGDKGYHERMMQDLVRDPNFIRAKRSGLANDPFRYTDDYQSSSVVQQFKQIGLIGNRGFDGLKLLRQFRFNQEWAATPKELRTSEMAEIYADTINKATGHGDLGRLPKSVKGIFFAPALEASKWAMMFKDPVADAATLIKRSGSSPEEIRGASQRMKFALAGVGTYMAALALNQGLLSATNSDQKINFDDPLHGNDWLAFKGFGMKGTPVSPLIRPVVYLMQLSHAFWGERSKFEKLQGSRASEAYDETGRYIRGKLHPFWGIAADAATGADFRGNTMPWNDDKISNSSARHGVHQYTSPEYLNTHLAPIPWEEAANEVWTTQGVGAAQQDEWISALKKAFFAGAFGAHVSDDKPTPAHRP